MSRPATQKPVVGPAGAAARMPERRGKPARSRLNVAWFAPLLAVATVFYLYPVFEVIRFSFTDSSLLEPDYSYTLSTYKDALGDPALPDIL
jgi:multiple sugar transport system permease protein